MFGWRGQHEREHPTGTSHDPVHRAEAHQQHRVVVVVGALPPLDRVPHLDGRHDSRPRRDVRKRRPMEMMTIYALCIILLDFFLDGPIV